MEDKTDQTKEIPEEFIKVIKDFVGDLQVTFPEYQPLINKWWKTADCYSYIENEEERTMTIETAQKKCSQLVFDFCQKKMPPRFFDILYQNSDIFKEDSEIDTEFLPHIHFKNLWNCDISDKTRETLWKYLQLILFSIVGTLNNKDAFGDTAKLFETINETDFKSKLEETLSHMQGLFDLSGNTDLPENLGSGINMEDMPKAEDIHEHINGMLGGKLGQLAKEIAEETASSLNIDMENVTDMQGVFSNLMKNPTKLMGLAKTVGDKLDSRIKSGEIKESELLSEATEIMNKMKDMPGMGNIQAMLNKMGMGNMGGDGKMNMGAMEAQLNKNMKMAKTKERIRAKAEAAQKARMEQQQQTQQQTVKDPNQNAMSEEELIKVFSSGEKVERTPRGAKPVNETNKKEGKKKKGK